MRVLVAYDMRYGNTKEIAEAIAEAFGVDHEVHCKKVSDIGLPEVRESDLVIVGSSTHGWNMSSDTRGFFKKLGEEKFEGKNAAAFDTKFHKLLTGSAAKKIGRKLRKLGFKIALPYLNTYVSSSEGPLEDGEIEKAKEFSARLIENMK